MTSDSEIAQKIREDFASRLVGRAREITELKAAVYRDIEKIRPLYARPARHLELAEGRLHSAIQEITAAAESLRTKPVDETKPEDVIPMTATGWQLYTNSEAKDRETDQTITSDAAALIIAGLVKAEVDALRASGSFSIAQAQDVVFRLQKKMSRFSGHGARDTEPDTVLVEVVERALGLEPQTLGRW